MFPKTDIQNCIIYQLRNSSKYVSYKDIKALMADLKRVYQAVDEQAALAGDFVVNEFHQLRRLLCVHGVNNYSRSWSLTTYSVFKSILLCATQTVWAAASPPPP